MFMNMSITPTILMSDSAQKSSGVPSLLQCSTAMWCELNVQVVAGWNGMAIQAFAQASLVLGSEETAQPREFPVEGCPPSAYLQAALQVCFRPIMAAASAAALLSHTNH